MPRTKKIKPTTPTEQRQFKAKNYNSKKEQAAYDRYFGGDEYQDAYNQWNEKQVRYDENYELTDFPLESVDLPEGEEAYRSPDGKTKLKIPKVHHYYRQACVKLADRKISVDLKARTPQYMVTAQPLQRILNFTLEEENFALTWQKLMSTVVLYGTAFLKEKLVHEKRTVKEIDTEEWAKIAEEKKVSMLDVQDIPYKEKMVEGWHLKAEVKSPREIILYPARSIQDAPRIYERNLYVIERFHEIFDELYPKAKYVQSGGDDLTDRTSDEREFDNSSDSIIGTGDIEVIEMYDREADLYLVTAGGVLLTEHDNPIPFNHKKMADNRGGIPYTQYDFDKIDYVDDTYGKGLPEIIEHPVKELNALRRMRLDFIKRGMNSKFLANPSFVSEEDLDQSEDGNVVWVETPMGVPISSAITELPVSNIKQDAFQETGQIDAEIERVLSLNDLADQQYAAATNASMAEQKKNDMFQHILDRFAKGELKRHFELRLSNIIQFYGSEPEKVAEVVGDDELTKLLQEHGLDGMDKRDLYKKGILELRKPNKDEEGFQETPLYKINLYKWVGYENEKGDREFEVLSPDVLKGKYNVVVNIEQIENKAMKAQKLIGWFQMMQQVGQMPEMQGKLNWMKIVEKITEVQGINFKELIAEEPWSTEGESEAIERENKWRVGKIEPQYEQATQAYIRKKTEMMPKTMSILQRKYPELLDDYSRIYEKEIKLAEKNSGVKMQPPQQQPGPGGPGGQPGQPPQAQGMPQETFEGSGAQQAPEAQAAETGGVPLAV